MSDEFSDSDGEERVNTAEESDEERATTAEWSDREGDHYGAKWRGEEWCDAELWWNVCLLYV